MFIKKISRVLIFLYTASAKIEVFWNDSLVLGEIDLQQGQFWTLFAQAAGGTRDRSLSRDCNLQDSWDRIKNSTVFMNFL